MPFFFRHIQQSHNGLSSQLPLPRSCKGKKKGLSLAGLAMSPWCTRGSCPDSNSVLCFVHPREKNKERTTHGTDAVCLTPTVGFPKVTGFDQGRAFFVLTGALNHASVRPAATTRLCEGGVYCSRQTLKGLLQIGPFTNSSW